jgi:integrase
MALFPELDKIIKTLYPNENTSEGVFTEFRKPLRQKYGDKSEIYIQSTHKLGVSRERSIQRKEDYKAKVASKGLMRRQQTPFYDDEIYSVIDKAIDSTNPLEQAIAVMLCTGSRGIEVLKVSTYNETDQEGFIKVKGIAKDRGNRGYANKVLIRPVIRCSAKQIVDAVKQLRSKLDVTGENDKVSDRYNSQINKLVKKFFPKQQPTSHKMRYISSNLAYLLFGEGGTENTYIQNYLGHEEGNTSRTYQSINVKLRNRIDTPSELEAKISELEHDSKQNKEEHTKIKEEIKQIDTQHKQPISRVMNVNRSVRYPQFVNPGNRGDQAEARRIELLTQLFKAAKKDKVSMSYRELKKTYNFGSNTLTKFNQMVRNGSIVI